RLRSASIASRRSARGAGRRVQRARLGGRHPVLRLARRPSVGQGVAHVLTVTGVEHHGNERRAVGTHQRDTGRRYRGGGTGEWGYRRVARDARLTIAAIRLAIVVAAFVGGQGA